MHFLLALVIAVNFWTARNVPMPCHPVAVPGADAQLPLDPAYPVEWQIAVPMATTSGCRILLSRRVYALREDAPQWYCAAVVHEAGHLAGLQHTETGVMAASLDQVDVPYECVHWKTFMRRHRARPEGPSPRRLPR